MFNTKGESKKSFKKPTREKLERKNTQFLCFTKIFGFVVLCIALVEQKSNSSEYFSIIENFS